VCLGEVEEGDVCQDKIVYAIHDTVGMIFIAYAYVRLNVLRFAPGIGSSTSHGGSRGAIMNNQWDGVRGHV